MIVPSECGNVYTVGGANFYFLLSFLTLSGSTNRKRGCCFGPAFVSCLEEAFFMVIFFFPLLELFFPVVNFVLVAGIRGNGDLVIFGDDAVW